MIFDEIVHIPADSVTLEGSLVVPEGAEAIVLFAHGSGSSRHSPRNNFVAEVLQKAGLATLLFDLLTEEEDSIYQTRFNIELLVARLKTATAWLNTQDVTKSLKLGYFGSSTGAAAALAAAPDSRVAAVVSRGGRPDLAMDYLPNVSAPTLLIVGGDDTEVIAMNEAALANLSVEKKLEIVPGATHLFEESGTLEEAARLAAEWFSKYLSV